MKLALLGKGKTGSKVIELIEQKSLPIEVSIFDSKTPITIDSLKGHDVILSFLPGDAFLEYRETLKSSGIPVVTGSTGFSWEEDFKNDLKAPWVYATNFSLGMNLVQQMIKTMSNAHKLFSDYSFNIHEVHHTKKLDAPSGTAITWRDWTGEDFEITSDRIGDVVGDHTLTFETQTEKITLRHEALDRKIFAEGALWATKKVLELEVGLYDFQEITLKELLS
ncbi:dihydrodipicolinate reductase C-terminal domain-containing protein [Halobacteriovorax sp. GB3]|uniref:4-hydroxy-tetrahydrodipicolinate reductase n=1 Tax=Halobacteriovorax sp. GB3 TaxID=2719615 RepID=UPI00235E8B8B|nr:dihydrodipicolinate reductase C-terminal domain-containing protein [Halobacteriovorax sp. GB3]MDD0852869.1 dihydrodipicolinate reductase C-terminal domain-containing protein [Halobacteriovorax sp. GB3]